MGTKKLNRFGIELAKSLQEDWTSGNRKKWAKKIADEKIALITLTPILFYPKEIANRFSWLLADLQDIDPAIVRPIVLFCFQERKNIQVLKFERSLAKMFWLSGVPDAIEGEVIDELFQWLQHPVYDVSIKTYSIQALHCLSEKYPELKNELKFAIQEQLEKNSVSFKFTGSKILNEIAVWERMNSKKIKG